MSKIKTDVLELYHTNFIKAVRLLMADRPELDSVKDVAEFLEIKYMSLHKIMDGSNQPTVQQINTVAAAGDFNLNWMLMNKGPERIHDITSLVEIKKLLTAINSKI